MEEEPQEAAPPAVSHGSFMQLAHPVRHMHVGCDGSQLPRCV